jgi:hypothetical protein
MSLAFLVSGKLETLTLISFVVVRDVKPVTREDDVIVGGRRYSNPKVSDRPDGVCATVTLRSPADRRGVVRLMTDQPTLPLRNTAVTDALAVYVPTGGKVTVTSCGATVDGRPYMSSERV